MISRPLGYSLKEGGSVKNILNSLNITYSQTILEEILNEEDPKVKSFERCGKCLAVLNSKIVLEEENSRECRFCGEPLELSKSQINKISLMDKDKNYILDQKKELNKKNRTFVLIVICLDYSSSMNSTYLRPANQNNSMKKNENQFITRKELLLLSLEKQLKILLDTNNKYNYQVFVITFEKNVLLYGQGNYRGDPIEMDQSFYQDFNKCKKFGQENAEMLFNNNMDSNLVYLFQKLHEKDADGITSLGPAVACGLGVIEALKPDMSQLYVFTDGMANNGIGEMKTEAKDNPNLDILAKEAYTKMGNHGVELGTIFHVICFEDEKSKLSILETLTSSKDSSLEQIKTQPIKIKNQWKEVQEMTYNENQVDELLSNSLRVSANSYGIKAKLRIFSSKENKLKVCRNTGENVSSKKKGLAKVLKKHFASITEKEENISLTYTVEKNFKLPLIIQFQFEYIKAETGEKISIVSNFSSEYKVLSKYEEIDLKACNLIMMNNDFLHDENLCNEYLVMMYLCKYFGETNKKMHPTFAEAEKDLKGVIEKHYKAEGKKLFEEAEKEAKDVMKEKISEEETIIKKKIQKKKIEEKEKEDNDGITIDVRKWRHDVEEDLSIRRKLKKKEKEEEKKETDDSMKMKKWGNFEDEYPSIKNKEKKKESENPRKK